MYEDEPYSNEYQRQAVERLHQRTKYTAVVASGNSEIKAYLTRQPVVTHDPGLGPYEIRSVTPLPDSSEFECMVKLSADWSEVEMDE